MPFAPAQGPGRARQSAADPLCGLGLRDPRPPLLVPSGSAHISNK